MKHFSMQHFVSRIFLVFAALFCVSNNATAYYVPNPANTNLISTDYLTAGDGLLTLEKNTGLEWLEVTQSIGRSYLDVSGEFGVGGDFEGFRFATTTDIFHLFSNAGVRTLGVDQDDGSGMGVEFLSNNHAAWYFVDLLGATDIDIFAEGTAKSIYAAYDDGGGVADRSGYAAVYYVPVGIPGIAATRSRFVTDNQSFSDAPSNQGNWLVRSTAVPEPATLAIFGLGLAGLGLMRRRKRAA